MQILFYLAHIKEIKENHYENILKFLLLNPDSQHNRNWFKPLLRSPS